MSYTAYHPVYLNLAGRRCLVVGGGPIAVEKVSGLKEAGAQVTVVAPEIHQELRQWHKRGEIEWQARTFTEADVTDAFLVIGATDDQQVNREVYEAGERLNRLANAVDDPDYCNFIMAAVVRQGPMQVAVSSAGCSPALAQRVRNRIASEIFDENVGDLAEFLGSWRPAVKDRLEGYAVRKGFWEQVLASDVPALLAVGKQTEAGARMEGLLAEATR